MHARRAASFLHHTSRAHGLAVADRYSTIRRFFHQQLRRSAHGTTLANAPMCSLACSGYLRISVQAQAAQSGWTYRAFSVSSKHNEEARGTGFGNARQNEEHSSNTKKEPEAKKTDEPPPIKLDSYPPFVRRLAMSLPHLHRPTRDDFLNAASGLWQRIRLRFRWLAIRSFRRYNADDISAFVTWFFMSQTIWLFIGTTTFFSVVFATLNSLRLQENVARALSDYLTSETGITIIFESAIVPKWKDSRISFKNVFITRRPNGAKIAQLRREAQAGHRASLWYDVSHHHHATQHMYDEEEEPFLDDYSAEAVNYSMFDLSVDSIDVTLSFARWFEGKGFVTDAVIKGVRGALDRRSVTWDPEHPLDPASFRHVGRPGDFELESLQLEDVLITVHQPGNFRPYTVSIFRADMRMFRKQWMFFDFLSAENVVGQFDNCLFSLHRPQSIGRTTEKELQDAQWGRMSRFRIDGVNIDHLQNMTTQEGPFSWLTSGKVDAVLDIKFPREPEDEPPLNALLGELADALSTAASSMSDRIPGQHELAKPPLHAPSDREPEIADGERDEPKVIIDIDLRFRDLKAAVPIFTSDLSYVNNALIRPIVAFMNANRTLVPIRCRAVTPLSDFDGSWTMWETGLMDIIALKVYEAMAHHVTQANFNRRLRAVSAWSLQMTVRNVISTLRNLVDPMAVHLRNLYDQAVPYEAVFAAPLYA